MVPLLLAAALSGLYDLPPVIDIEGNQKTLAMYKGNVRYANCG